MKFMTKELTRAVEERRVRGMVFAPTAPRLTHALYADDVVIFGEATQNEVSEVSRILMEFGKFSGLIVNPAKSTVWFSVACDEQNRQVVLDTIHVRVSGQKEKYLGIYMSSKNQGNDGTDRLLEDLPEKLPSG
jgi:Reverse transcriptase (RNA-dependent DNA polymerase)